MFQLKAVADRDCAPLQQKNAAMARDAAKRLPDRGPLFVLDSGPAAQ